jgi:hypothetical protein
MGLRRVMRDIAIGSLLIQSDPSSGEPMLLHSMLPFVVQRREESKDAWVFLLDAQVRSWHCLNPVHSSRPLLRSELGRRH